MTASTPAPAEADILGLPRGNDCASSGPAWVESDRLAALDRYAILDTPREPEFDDIARLAADIFDAPIAVVNLIASGRQWFKAEVGIGADELPLDVSICAHAILQPGIFVVPDTTADDRFRCNPLVAGRPGLRFYAGALLETPEGLPLGTVCVLDTKPRPEGVTPRQRLTLEVLARQVMAQLELRRAVAERDRWLERQAAVEDTLRTHGLLLERMSEGVSLSNEAGVIVYTNRAEDAMFGYAPGELVGQHVSVQSAYPAEANQRRVAHVISELETKGAWEGEWLNRRKDGTIFTTDARITAVEIGGRPHWLSVQRDVTDHRRAEERLQEETRTLETLNQTGASLAGELDLERLVQRVTDAGVKLTGAAFGAFFYNVLDEAGEALMLYTLSGADRADFEKFGMPRATAVFGPTFRNEGVVRSDDILADPRYGQSGPPNGMPAGHLPARSYLAVPVVSRSGEVIGGLFFGHPEPARFTERHEHLLTGIASQAAVAVDNARLYQATQRELDERRRAEEALRRSEERLRLAQRNARAVTWEFDVASGLTHWSDVETLQALAKQSLGPTTRLKDWVALIHPDDKQAYFDQWAAVMEEGEGRVAFRIVHHGEPRWLEVFGRVTEQRRGNAAKIVGITLDVTERMAAEEALRDREQQLSAIFAQTAAGLAQVDLTGRFTLVNDRFCEITGRSRGELLQLKMQEITHPEDLAGNVPLFERAVTEGTPYSIEKRYVCPDGSTVWVSNSVSVISDSRGRAYGVLAVTLDISERKRWEAHQALLIAELAHRVKNSLAIVQSLAQQSFKDGVPAEVGRAGFEARLAALSAAHSLLTRQNWSRTSLAEVIEAAITSTAGSDAGRVGRQGDDVMLGPQTAVSVAMAVHELCTNAIKYGALATDAGSVDVRWTVEDRAEGPRLHLSWSETGGPPVVPPTRRGFGSRMIERGLAAELQGKVRLEFRPEGLVCTIDAPLPRGA